MAVDKGHGLAAAEAQPFQSNHSSNKPTPDINNATKSHDHEPTPPHPPTPKLSNTASMARIRESLLDVDSLRSAGAFSTEPAKFSSVYWRGLLRVLFFPLAYPWWKRRRLSLITFCIGSFLYLGQGLASFVVLWGGWPALVHWCGGGREGKEGEREGNDLLWKQLQAEVTIPVVLWLFCALAYGHLCAASHSDGIKKKKRRVVVEVPMKVKEEDEDEEEEEEELEEENEGEQQNGDRPSLQKQKSEEGAYVRGSTADINALAFDMEEEEEEEDDDEEEEMLLDDEDEEEHHKEELYSEELQEQEEKHVLLNSSSRSATPALADAANPIPSSSSSSSSAEPNPRLPQTSPGPAAATTVTAPTAVAAAAAAFLRPSFPSPLKPPRAAHLPPPSSASSFSIPSTTTAAAAAAASAQAEDEEEEEGMLMWGLGPNGLGGGASVRVTFFNSRGERFKVAMTLSQLRRKLVERVGRTQQDWFYRTGVPCLGAGLAAVVPLMHRGWVAWEEEKQKEEGKVILSSSSSSSSGGGGVVGDAWAWFATHVLLLQMVGEKGSNCSSSSSSSRRSSMVGDAWAWFGTQVLLLQGAAGERSSNSCSSDSSSSVLIWAILGIRLLSLLSVSFLAYATFASVLSVTELVFKKRYKYSKLFSMLTSLSKASRYAIPHFTLKNPLNIKMWMALRAGRAWLRRYEAQRVADTVVSSTFRIVVLLLTILCIEFFLCKDKRPFLNELWHWELLVWGGISSIFLLRFFSLGTRTNEKFGDTTILLTEQLNVQLRIFELCCRSSNDRAKRETLQISSNVLKLAVKLLKELDSPNRVSGLSMSPMLVRVTRVILLSALSALVSDVFGFKLKVNQLLK